MYGSFYTDIGDLHNVDKTIDPCKSNCFAKMTDYLNIVNADYPESSKAMYCKCDIELNSNTTIKFYDAGFTGSGEDECPLGVSVRQRYSLCATKYGFREEQIQIPPVVGKNTYTVTILIQPYNRLDVVNRTWFWIHLTCM